MDIQLDELVRTREQLHQASQLVSAVPRSFLNYDVSDSNASLIWDSDHRVLVSEKIRIDGSAYQSGLIIRDFSLILIKDDRVLNKLSLEGKSYQQGNEWLAAALQKCAFESDKLSLKLPYVIPIYETISGKPFCSGKTEVLLQFEKLFDNANRTFHAFLNDFENASEVRCWPHHFDLGSLLAISIDDEGNLKKSVGIGMSPGDEMISQPYYYVNSWPSPSKEVILDKTLLGKGQWHQDGWIGSKLLFQDFRGSANIEDQVIDYLKSSTTILSEA